MSTVAAPADRRFRRAHVRPARKRTSGRLLGWRLARYGAVAFVVGCGLYKGTMVAAHADVLQIQRIVVRGNERMSKEDVSALVGGLRGESLVWADLERWRGQLLTSPWIRDAVLRRSLPGTVEVVVLERQPAMLARVNGDMYLVDDRGVMIDRYNARYGDLDLPLVDGLAVSEGDSRALADAARADLVARVLASVNTKPDVAKRLSQIDVSDLHNVTVILSNDTALLDLGEDQFLPRLQTYLELGSALRDRVPEIDRVDLRFDDRIYVRPVAKADRKATVKRTQAVRPGTGARAGSDRRARQKR